MQSTDSILLIKPSCFQFNTETESSNLFQEQLLESKEDIMQKAIEEFNQLAQLLEHNGIDVTIIEDSKEPQKPDAVFPNNWISFHDNGKIILYPMLAENRRVERRQEIIEQLSQKFIINQTIDFSYYEQESKFLEGTGSVILDRKNKKAYACLSPRTNKELLFKLCEELDYLPIFFYSFDEGGNEIYHTNVMMCLGTHFAVVCLSSIQNEKDKKDLIYEIEKSNKEIIDIDFNQVKCFAGNMLELKNKKGNSIIVLSQSAYSSLNQNQISRLQKHGKLLPLLVNTIEKVGGGSVRCMIAEIFLPKKLTN